MLSRALSLATVMLLIGGFAAIPVQAQNLEAGKSPSQIFAGTCNACHKSPRGLLKTVSPGSLPGFLRQHYTTSSEMASLLSAFLVSNGASDTRYVGSQPPKLGKDGKPEAKPPSGSPEQLDRFGRRMRPPAPVQEDATRPDTAPPPLAAKPDADGISPQAETGRQGRNGKRKPGEPSDATKPAVDGQPAQAASERGPDGRRLSAKQKLSKRGKPGSEEPPKTDAAKDDSATGEPAKDDKSKSEPKSETAKDEGGKPEGVKPSGESKPETAKSDAKPESRPDSAKSESAKSDPAKPDAPKAPGSGEAPALRADPVPAVTPAPKSADGETRPPQVATPAPSSPPAAVAVAPPAVTALAPPPAPIAPAGPPAPPISQ
jgi:hypothetical protein